MQGSLETSLERSSDGGIADIDSSGEINLEELFRMRNRRKLSSAWIHKLFEVGKNMIHEPKKKYKEDGIFKNFWGVFLRPRHKTKEWLCVCGLDFEVIWCSDKNLKVQIKNQAIRNTTVVRIRG